MTGNSKSAEYRHFCYYSGYENSIAQTQGKAFLPRSYSRGHPDKDG